MTRLRLLAAHYHVWLKLFVGLSVLTLWVDWSFVPGWLTRHYTFGQPLLHDLTRGSNLAILFALLPRQADPNEVRVVLVGDSSIGGTYPVEDYLAFMLSEQLRDRFPGKRVRVFDFSIIGLYAQDALVLMAKAFAFHPDLVVYAVSPRIAPSSPATPWATAAVDVAFDWDVLQRVDPVTLVPLVGRESLGRTMVYSWWRVAALRTVFAQLVTERLAARSPALGRAVVAVTPAPLPPPPGERPGGYLFPRDRYRLDPPTRSTRAFDALVRLCARERRCLIYHLPVNPSAERGFEPGLLDEFVAYVNARTGPAGVPFLDFRGFGKPENFRINLIRIPDVVHPTREGHAAFAPVLADAVVHRLGELAR